MQPNQPTTSQQALSQLQEAESSAQNPNDILTAQNQQFGVQGAQDTVTGLRGAINSTTALLKQVAPSVMGRTGGSLVTNAQATKQIQNEQAPLTTNLTDQTTQYNQADQDLQSAEQKAQTAASGIYQGQQDKQSYLQNIYNALFGAEKDAADRAEQAREADLSAKAAGNGGINLGDFGSSSSSAPSVQDQAYKSVQNFLKGTDAQIKSDYAATLKSANYGNALDKLKIQLYQQSRPDLFKNAGVLGAISSSPLTLNKNTAGLRF